MDWQVVAGIVGVGAVYVLFSLVTGRLVTYRTIERMKEPFQFRLHIALFCICLGMILFGLGA